MLRAFRRIASIAVAAAAILVAGLAAPRDAVAGDRVFSANYDLPPGNTTITIDAGTEGTFGDIEIALGGPTGLEFVLLEFTIDGNVYGIAADPGFSIHEATRYLAKHGPGQIDGLLWLTIRNTTDSTLGLHLTVR